MQVFYLRSGGRTPPRDHEQLEISQDGSFDMWRSVGWATVPPTPVGRFRGALDGPSLQELMRLAGLAAREGDIERTPAFDSPREAVVLDEQTRATLGIHDELDGPWGELLSRLRVLLHDLTAYPLSSLALEVLPGGEGIRLRREGSGSIGLNLGALSLRAVLWRGGVPVDDRQMQDVVPAGEEKIETGPGWSLELPLKHGFAPERDDRITVYANLELINDDWPVPVSLQASWPPTPAQPGPGA